jgi:hypothetical protein
LRSTLIIYEVYGFYNLYYGNNSFIRNITENAKTLNLQVDMTTNRTYSGASVNYIPTQTKASNYLLSNALNTTALFARTIRKLAYSSYMSMQKTIYGDDYSGYNIEIDYTDIDFYTKQICAFEPDTHTPSGSVIQPTPSVGDLITYGANFVVANI